MSEFGFQEGEIDGYFVMTRNSFDDHRGSFSRLYSRTIFKDNMDFAGIEHVNLSINPAKHTLRGFHYSLSDAGEKRFFIVLPDLFSMLPLMCERIQQRTARKKSLNFHQMTNYQLWFLLDVLTLG